MSTGRQGVVALELAEIEQLTRQALVRAGASREHADAVAHVVMQAEQDGSISHGLFRVPGYVAALQSGKVKGDAQPTVTMVTPSLLRCDGDRCFAPLAHRRSLDRLYQAAKSSGIAALSITRTAHWAALWPETEWLATRGLVGFACCSFLPTVAPHGCSQALYGTNPMSFAWPRTPSPRTPSHETTPAPPLVFDMATASMALGDVQLHAKAGKAVPAGSGLDRNGNPTQEAQRILDGGVLLPFGGYKGSHIAMAIELLSGALLGESASFQTAQNDDGLGPPLGGQLVVALDPDRFARDPAWLDNGDLFIQRLSSIEGVRLPGERRHKERQRTGPRHVPSALIHQISSCP
eukprot:Tamp_21598.p1 GENE.Tamp_21598~~Tamp_21598.p1  ORF type:complete len:375 (+),score=29.01 Tamp_21598:81-1127(+)